MPRAPQGCPAAPSGNQARHLRKPHAPRRRLEYEKADKPLQSAAPRVQRTSPCTGSLWPPCRPDPRGQPQQQGDRRAAA
eukprot:7381779-Prymnesium_polylepis.1